MILTSYVKLPINKNKKLCKATALFEDLQILLVIVAEQRKLASEEASWSFVDRFDLLYSLFYLVLCTDVFELFFV